MKRRSFLLGALTALAAPLLAKGGVPPIEPDPEPIIAHGLTVVKDGRMVVPVPMFVTITGSGADYDGVYKITQTG